MSNKTTAGRMKKSLLIRQTEHDFPANAVSARVQKYSGVRVEGILRERDRF